MTIRELSTDMMFLYPNSAGVGARDQSHCSYLQLSTQTIRQLALSDIDAPHCDFRNSAAGVHRHFCTMGSLVY